MVVGEPRPRTGGLLPCAADELPLVARGEGVYLYDTDGNGYLDGSSGAVAANLGHGNEQVAAALADQARTVAFAHRTQFRSRAAEELADLVADLAPEDLSWSLFTSSGSEANELAIRLAISYWHELGRPGKTAFLSRAVSYHGSTLGALSLTGLPRRRAGAEPLLHGFSRLHAGRASAYLPSATELAAELDHMDPTSVAAVVTEPVGGASGGALVPPDGYHERLRTWCDANDVLWIADEVMCGFGRTGRWFAVEHWDATPDLLVFGKGVSGGYAPLAGVVVSERVARPLLDGPGYVSFGHTYSNVPVTSAVGVAVVREMERLHLVENARARGQQLATGLDELIAKHPCAREQRGLGLLRAVELVDPATGEPAAAERQLTRRLVAAARDVGLLVYPGGVGMHEGHGDGVLVAPPLPITAQEMAELLTKLHSALSALDGGR